MGGNTTGVNNVDAATLQARALELQKLYEETNMDYTSKPISDKKTGAIFTYKKDPNTGKVTYTYQYHNVQAKDIVLFQRTQVPTASAGLGNLTSAQYDEYLTNNPSHVYATGYAADEDAIAELSHAEEHLNSYDKDTRSAAREDYREIVQKEFYLSGGVDPKAAKKMAKLAEKDARAGQRAELREVFIDKDAYEKAKKELKAEQKAAKKRIEEAEKLGFLPNEDDMEIMERSVEYISDEDVREYIQNTRHKARFYDEAGNFSSEKYKEWAKTHLQGDNTLTTSERPDAAMTTGLEKGDMKKAVKYAGYNAQKDHTMTINMSKALLSIAGAAVLGYFANKNVTAKSDIVDQIKFALEEGENNDTYIALKDVVSNAVSHAAVEVNFRDPAARNAAMGAILGSLLNSPFLDPEGARDKKAAAITAATITREEVFRGHNVTDIQGSGEIENCNEERCYNYDGTDPVAGQEATPDENVFKLKMNEKCNVIFWYQTADAYDIPEGFKKADVYNKVREANGDPEHNKYPPDVVGLPEYLTLTDKAGNEVRIQRKKTFNIKGTCYTPPSGGKLQTGKTYEGRKGTEAIQGRPGNYRVYDCQTGETLVENLPNEQAAIDWINAQKQNK